MKTITTILLFFTVTFLSAQPALADLNFKGPKDLVISVVECTNGCDVDPGIYQLMEDGYSKIVDLSELDSKHPNVTMASNSKKVLEVLSLVGIGDYVVKTYEEFWISDCAKQSQYVLYPAEDRGIVNTARR